MVQLHIEQGPPFYVTFAGVREQLAADRKVLPLEVDPNDVFTTIATLGSDAGHVEIVAGGYLVTPKRRIATMG